MFFSTLNRCFSINRMAMPVCLFISSPAFSTSVNFDVSDVVLGNSGGNYTRVYSMDNVPFIYDTNTIIGSREARKYEYRDSNGRQVLSCAGLDAKVNLPVAGVINGQSIYKLNDYIGLVIWAGDTAWNKAKPLSGNQWNNVFSGFCGPDAQGYSVFVKPVIMKRTPTKQFIIPRTILGSIKIRNMGKIMGGTSSAVNTEFKGKTEFTFSINNMVITNGAKSCKLLTPSNMNIALPAISTNSISRSGDELFAGQTNIRLQCEEGVTVWATLTDATNPANRTDNLTLTSSTATGVGLKIYKNDDTTAVKFGPDSPIKGNINQWKLSTGTEIMPEVTLKAYYVNKTGNITPGELKGIATFTFSYQ